MKIERWHKILKGECNRVKTPLSLEDTSRLVAAFVVHYNEDHLHGAIGYVTPAAKLAGRDREIFTDRDRKLNDSRESRRAAREVTRPAV
jgi:putative transposase